MLCVDSCTYSNGDMEKYLEYFKSQGANILDAFVTIKMEPIALET